MKENKRNVPAVIATVLVVLALLFLLFAILRTQVPNYSGLPPWLIDDSSQVAEENDEIPAQGPYTSSQIESMLLDSAQTYQVLREYLPEDYRTLIDELEEMSDNADFTQSDLYINAARKIADLRRAYAGQAYYIEDDYRREILTMQKNMAIRLESDFGYQACNNYLLRGPAGLESDKLNDIYYANQLDSQTAKFFEAVAMSLENPIVIAEASKEDWTQALSLLKEDFGATDKNISLMASPDVTDSALCQTYLLFYQMLVTRDEGWAERVRRSSLFSEVTSTEAGATEAIPTEEIMVPEIQSETAPDNKTAPEEVDENSGMNENSDMETDADITEMDLSAIARERSEGFSMEELQK